MDTFNQLIHADTPVLVDFYTDWCVPCRQMSDVLQQLKERRGEGVRVLRINVEKEPPIGAIYSVQSIPTLILFKNGRPLWRQNGYLDYSDLARVIDMVLAQQNRLSYGSSPDREPHGG